MTSVAIRAASARTTDQGSNARLREGLAPVADRSLFVVRRQKVPYGADGRAISGSYADLPGSGKLMTLEAALAMAESNGYDGVGIAFFPGCGLIGLDIDKCRTPDGVWTFAEPQRGALSLLKAHAFVEASMSGTGLHLFALGEAETLKANGILELFGDRNFIALTGVGQGVARPVPQSTIKRLRALIEGVRGAGNTARTVDAQSRALRPVNAAVLMVTTSAVPGAESQERVRSALFSAPPPKDYGEWLRLVWAVRSALGDGGYDIARAWSATDPDKFDPVVFDKVWHSDKAPAGGVTGATLFKWARDSGWADPTRTVLRSAHRQPEADATDAALSQLFVEYCKARGFAYDHAQRTWLRWDATRWAPCTRDEQVEAFKAMTVGLIEDAARASADDFGSTQAKRRQTLALRAQTATHMRAAIALAQSDVSLAVRTEDFDRDPCLLNTPSGVVDLRTGRLAPHDSGMKLRRICGVGIDLEADCPHWLRFLSQAAVNDPAWIDYMQRQCGYLLGGDVSEERMFFWFGSGRNGKSVLANILRHILGDYAATAPASLFMRFTRDASSPTPELAMLPGVRLLLANETEAGSRLSAQTLKVAVSTEAIAARHLYGAPFSFTPTHKVVMRGNHLPIIAEADEGTWRRIDLVPFDLQLQAHEADPELENRLLQEGPAILAWMVRGHLKWRKQGLMQPPRVREASLSYRKDSDVLAQWLDGRCDIGPALMTPKSAAFDSYRAWTARQGMGSCSMKSLTRMLTERGYGVGRETTGARRETYRGFALKPDRGNC